MSGELSAYDATNAIEDHTCTASETLSEVFHFYHACLLPQFTGALTLSGLLDKPWSEMSAPLPSGICLISIAQNKRVQHKSHFSSVFPGVSRPALWYF